jgi:hypothetical protein
MKTMRSIHGLAAVAMIAVPQVLLAQGSNCTNLASDCGDINLHSAPLISTGALEYTHVSCEFTAGEFPVHWSPCNPAEDDLFKEEAYLRAAEAARDGDFELLISMAVDLKDFVVLNRARRSVQLLSCDGAGVSASLVLPPEGLRRAEELLLRSPD